MELYKHILVALDGSPLSEQALPHAEGLAKTLGARLTIMSVVEPYIIALPATPAPVPAYNIDTDIEALATEREDYLETIKSEVASQVADVRAVMRRGKPADEILFYVKDENVDLIVMTTHGRSGISRFIYGSVAESVLHGATVPVLLVKVKDVGQR